MTPSPLTLRSYFEIFDLDRTPKWHHVFRHLEGNLKCNGNLQDGSTSEGERGMKEAKAKLDRTNKGWNRYMMTVITASLMFLQSFFKFFLVTDRKFMYCWLCTRCWRLCTRYWRDGYMSMRDFLDVASRHWNLMFCKGTRHLVDASVPKKKESRFAWLFCFTMKG